MTRTRRAMAVFLAIGSLLGGLSATAVADQPGPGSKPQCAGGQFPGGNGNPHCPQNK